MIPHGREVLTSRRQLLCYKLSFLEERGCSDDLKTKTYIPWALFISRTLHFSYLLLYMKLGSVLVICRLCGYSIRNLRCSKYNLNYFPFLAVNFREHTLLLEELESLETDNDYGYTFPEDQIN